MLRSQIFEPYILTGRYCHTSSRKDRRICGGEDLNALTITTCLCRAAAWLRYCIFVPAMYARARAAPAKAQTYFRHFSTNR